MNVLGTDSIILGTRKLWRMFLIKQKFTKTTAFLEKNKFLQLHNQPDLFPDHVILTGRQMTNLVSNFEYLLLLFLLTAAKF